MIFCTVGNDHHKFDRFIQLIDKAFLSESGNLKVFLQHGYSARSRILPDQGQEPFLSKERFDSYIKTADAVVCHAGAGTIAQCLQVGKIPIVVPRLFEQNEHLNNHQLDIANYFHDEGMCYVVQSCSELLEALSLASGRDGNKYQSTKHLLIDSLRSDFEEILK